MTRKTETAAVLFRKERGRPVPLSAFDAERFDEWPEGQEFEVVRRTKRSLLQLRLYWAVLYRVVEATGQWASADHLHDLLKVELGYTRPYTRFDGTIEFWPDSAALTGMNDETFRGFFDRAMEMLAAKTGIDPLELRKTAA